MSRKSRKNKHESLVQNAADPKQVRQAGKEERFLDADEVQDLQTIMSERIGRRFICNLLDRCGWKRISFTGNSQTFFHEGERNIALWLEAELSEHCFENMILMIQEARQDRENLLLSANNNTEAGDDGDDDNDDTE